MIKSLNKIKDVIFLPLKFVMSAHSIQESLGCGWPILVVKKELNLCIEEPQAFALLSLWFGNSLCVKLTGLE